MASSLPCLLLATSLATFAQALAQTDPAATQVNEYCANKDAGKYPDITAPEPYCSGSYIQCNGNGTGSVQGIGQGWLDNQGLYVPGIWNDFAKGYTWPGALGTFNCDCTRLYAPDKHGPERQDLATACTVCTALQATGVCDAANLNIIPDYSCLAPFPVDPLTNVVCKSWDIQLQPISPELPSSPQPADSPSPEPSSPPPPLSPGPPASPPLPASPRPPPKPKPRAQCKDLDGCCEKLPVATVLSPGRSLSNSTTCSTQLVQCRAEGGVLLDLHYEPVWGVPYVLQPLDVSGTYAVLPGAVGTKGCDCREAYQGAPAELQEQYRLACEVCQKQTTEVHEIPLPSLDGICTSCLYSGPVPKKCAAAPPPPRSPALPAPSPPQSRRRS